VAKNERGLPAGFNLDIPTVKPDAPVQIDDYLDMETAAPLPSRPAAAPRKPAPARVLDMPRPAPEAPAESVEEAAPSEPRTFPPRTKKRKQKGPARKQVNTTPEALRMIEELIDHVQTYSVQKDAKASEVFHALVLALYEAREHIDLSEVPGRGKWGTPTAKAFPISLKNAFQEAIAVAYKKNRR
jgi:hypothetical protein